MNHSLKFNWVPWCSFLTNSPFSFCLLFLCRYSSIFRKQFRLYSRWQSSTLAKIPSGPHRDGRPQRCPVTDSPQRPLQHTAPSAQSQLESFQLPLPTPRLPDSLQTPQQNPYRSATEFNTGPPLSKEGVQKGSVCPPCFSLSAHSQLPSHLLRSEESSSWSFFSPYPQMRCAHSVFTIFCLIVKVSVDPAFEWVTLLNGSGEEKPF